MNHTKTIDIFMSTFYPELSYDIRVYNENYYIIVTNELRVNYNEYDYSKKSYIVIENNKEFTLSTSVYDLVESFIPTICNKIYFHYIEPMTSSICVISKPIKIVSGYTTTYTTTYSVNH